MRKEKISNIVGNINEKYIDEATAYADTPHYTSQGKWFKIAAIAACLTTLLVGTGLLVSTLTGPSPNSNTDSNSTDYFTNPLNRPYKSFSATESAVVWPWEYKTASEKYLSVEFNDTTYRTRSRAIDKELLENMLGSCTATGYDMYTDTTYTKEFQVYKIKGITSDALIAVDMDEEICIFAVDNYAPPATLGTLIDTYNLTETLALSRFTTYEEHHATGYFNLKDDKYIWDILSKCNDAKFIQDDNWTHVDRDSICFTATSTALGAYKQAFYITKDGYLWTNIFNWAYIYHIGQDAAGKIIDYANNNSTQSQYLPYYYSIGGTITEINKDYVLIDDSILCTDANEGITFKVPVNNPYIARAIGFLGFKTGDLVIVEFTGQIDIDKGYIIDGIVSMSEAFINDGSLVVPE